VNKKKFSNYIKSFDFNKLFIDLGWDNYSNEIPLAVDEEAFNLSGLVEKRGFVIVLCPPAKNGEIPLHTSRKKIENQFCKLHQEHLIIYENRAKTKQIWQFNIHEKDKPKRVHEILYNIEQDPEILYQRARGLIFTLDEEGNITLVDVILRFKEGFGKNTERVTKKFYDEFKKHHTSFLDFIEGIDDVIKAQSNKNKQWYASLMLSRLMFCYFIQKRGYLDNDVNYLQNKLKEVKQKEGENIFYSFYRDFLLQLFHQGLGQPEKARELTVDLGNIPYLNGGLFDVHELERLYEGIKIKDDAFDEIFNFFDQWNWHLDTSVEAAGRDINPDVIGYIFEKHINDRAAMGAYYTKEDITDYIGKNTIIPFLFGKVRKEYPRPFKSDGYIWTFLQNSGDTYIYEAVKKGIYEAANDKSPRKIEELTIPENIAIGLDTQKPELLERRKEWNTKTPEKYALPTEIWRETIDRWKRYFEVKNKINNGEINEINDFITYNLNIRQFIQDILENTDDSDLIRHFYKTIHSITILDPTCGSGAFLFAALNILEPLYEVCIERMEQFTTEALGKCKFFDEVLTEVNSEEHPNLQYYIYKTIILNNLYGVDIMHEAVEIAKLRLFLKMVGAVDMNLRKPNFGLEPLPDIDFNIRAGNTLVGFATEAEFKNAVKSIEPLFAPGIIKDFEDEFRIIATAFRSFQDAQLITDKGKDTHKKAKAELQKRLVDLNDKLNAYLASTYGIDKNKIPDENKFKKRYQEWYSSHLPFHWFAEFYEIIDGNGGFDVIIGNPPYVEYSKTEYSLRQFKTIKCGNIYACVVERCFALTIEDGRFGMIVPLSSICTNRMAGYQELLLSNKSWNSLYAERPSKLFTGAEVQLVISLVDVTKSKGIYSTIYNKWGAEFREYLFNNIYYIQLEDFLRKGSIPKIGSNIELCILSKLNNQKLTLNNYRIKSGQHYISYRNAGGRYYKVILNYEPQFKVNNIHKRSSTYQFLYFEDNKTRDAFCALMNSSLFFWYWLTYSDTWHMVNRELDNFQIKLSAQLKKNLSTINEKLMQDLLINGTKRKEKRNKGKNIVEFTQYNVRKSKHIIDEIDNIIAQHYGFTQDEVDFIINYDIKYRMGKALLGEDDEETENE